jgi:pteridine reductase
MPAVDLHGKLALVTGAGTRVGAAIARALAVAGCDVIVHYASSAAGAQAVAAEIAALGRRALPLQADLTDRAALARLAAEALGVRGSLDVLVHSAANFDRVEPAALDAAAWDRAFALNVTAPYLLTLALAGSLRAARGSVIAITCVSADRPWQNYLPYSASKAALANLVKGLALALAPEARVNAVAPGTVLPPADYDEAKLGRIRARVPLRRIGEAADVARAVVFLAENDYVTGQTITVDGGRSAGV